jgi:hypothetical protein
MSPYGQRITVDGKQVGVVGLEDLFRTWKEGRKKAKDLSKDQIIQAIRSQNYIITHLEGEYAEAIRIQYAAYCEKSPQR